MNLIDCCFDFLFYLERICVYVFVCKRERTKKERTIERKIDMARERASKRAKFGNFHSTPFQQ